MKFLDIEWKGKNYKLYIKKDKDNLWIHYQGQTYVFKEELKDLKKTKTPPLKSQELITALLPGRIQKIFVKAQDQVKKGQNLLILSAMKIEYSFKAEQQGHIEQIFCKEGQTVTSGKKLIKIKYQKTEDKRDD